MNNDDYISRAYTIEQIEKAKKQGFKFTYETLIDFIKILPSVEKLKQGIKSVTNSHN